MISGESHDEVSRLAHHELTPFHKLTTRGSRTVENDEGRKSLTLHLERTPLEPSIQTYSAMMAPLWSSFRYFSSCENVNKLQKWLLQGKTLKSGCFGAKLTLAVLELIVDSAYDWESARVLPSVAVSRFPWEINPTMIADVVALVV